MNDPTRLVGGRLLRRGYTTGSCAAAAAKAAAQMLLTGAPVRSVTLKTPKGIVLTLDVAHPEITPDYALCAIQKDSGDDPDVTNGCLVYARVALAPRCFVLEGGEGIGRVTKPGLDQPVGMSAINTVPRRMMEEACREVCAAHGYTGGLSVVVSIPGGAELAARTFNPRMGIVGGLSILGTTGIVEPMSEAAVADTFRAELGLLYAAGHRNVVLTIGNYGEAFARDRLGLDMASTVMCSNFIGETLSAAAEKGFTSATLVGHIGKLVKLGIGITNTHSAHGDGRMETLLACALEAGADRETLLGIQGCVSTDAAVKLLEDAGLLGQTMALLAERVADTIGRHVAGSLAVRVVCFCGLGDAMKEVFSI